MAGKMGDGCLARLILPDQQERSEWESRFSNSTSSLGSLGEVIAEVYQLRDVHWQSAMTASPAALPPAPPVANPTPKSRAATAIPSSTTLRDGTPLCAAWQGAAQINVNPAVTKGSTGAAGSSKAGECLAAPSTDSHDAMPSRGSESRRLLRCHRWLMPVWHVCRRVSAVSSLDTLRQFCKLILQSMWLIFWILGVMRSCTRMRTLCRSLWTCCRVFVAWPAGMCG